MVSPRVLCGKLCPSGGLKPQRSPRWGNESQRQTGKRRVDCASERFHGCRLSGTERDAEGHTDRKAQTERTAARLPLLPIPAQNRCRASRNGEDTGTDIRIEQGSDDGSPRESGKRYGRLKCPRRPARPLSTGGAVIPAPAFGHGENAESAVVPLLRERPRKAVRGGWRGFDCIPDGVPRVLATAAMPSAQV